MMGVQRSTSALKILPISAAPAVEGVAPIFSIISCTLFSLTTATLACSSARSTAGGVLAGAHRLYQP